MTSPEAGFTPPSIDPIIDAEIVPTPKMEPPKVTAPETLVINIPESNNPYATPPKRPDLYTGRMAAAQQAERITVPNAMDSHYLAFLQLLDDKNRDGKDMGILDSGTINMKDARALENILKNPDADRQQKILERWENAIATYQKRQAEQGKPGWIRAEATPDDTKEILEIMFS